MDMASSEKTNLSRLISRRKQQEPGLRQHRQAGPVRLHPLRYSTRIKTREKGGDRFLSPCSPCLAYSTVSFHLLIFFLYRQLSKCNDPIVFNEHHLHENTHNEKENIRHCYGEHPIHTSGDANFIEGFDEG